MKIRLITSGAVYKIKILFQDGLYSFIVVAIKRGEESPRLTVCLINRISLLFLFCRHELQHNQCSDNTDSTGNQSRYLPAVHKTLPGESGKCIAYLR